MLVGVNPVVSHGHAISMPNPTGTVRDITRRGQVWVIDPRRTETARLATGHLAPRPSTDHAVLAYLVREILRDGMKSDVPVQGIDALDAAVEPFTLEHTARLADVAEAELTRLCAAVRARRCVAVETGTGVTMTADRANVTQWLAWVLMILTGAMNRPGGTWFHPGFAYQLEAFGDLLPITPIEGSFGPGPSSRPEAQAFINEWPCAVLPDEIAAGNVRALINVGGSLVTVVPGDGQADPGPAEPRGLRHDGDHQQRDHGVGHPRAADQGSAGTARHHHSRHPEFAGVRAIQPRRRRPGRRAAVDVVGLRRTGPAARLRARQSRRPRQQHRRRRARGSAGRRPDQVRRGGGHGLGGGPAELPAPWVDAHIERMGGWRLAPPLLVDQLAALAAARAAGDGAAPAARELNGQLDFLGERAEILIHPDDGAAAGVVDGQRVTVRSANGSSPASRRSTTRSGAGRCRFRTATTRPTSIA